MTATAEYVTFEAVEIAHVGMDWPSAGGPVTLTMQHLADAVAAANDDPHILSPRLKIGHDDPRFNESPTAFDPFAYHGPLREDGNPVYGKVDNLRLSEDGMVLLGDYVEVPGWLGNALPSAYPSRSLEGDSNVKTEGGKTYSFVITAVALLGEPLPAITCLDDLVRELTGGPTAVLEQAPVTLGKEPNMPVAAEASTDAVRSQFWDDFAQGDRFWWWPCEIRVDQGWILADDDEGHLYRVPFTTDPDGNTSFGDPTRGVLDFREVPDTEAAEPGPVTASRGVTFATAAAAGRPKDRVRPAAANQPEGGQMSMSSALLERLGLPEDATDEQALARLDELENASKVDTDPDPGDTTDADTGVRDAEPVAAKTVTVSEQVWLDQQTRLTSLEASEKERNEREATLRRDTKVADGVRAGRIAPAETDHYRSMMEVDEAKTTELLMSLAPGRVPVTERAVAAAAETDHDTHQRIMASFGVTARHGKENH